MTIEAKIRQALREEADTAEATSQKWDAVHASARSQRARRRALRIGGGIAGLAAAVVAAIAILIALGPVERGRVVGEPGAEVPAFVVTAEGDRVVVRSSSDGREMRVLASGDHRGGGADAVTVSRDGSTVYFQRRVNCVGLQRDAGEIMRVPIGGGTITSVARGTSPLISPDGRWLAFGRNTSEAVCGVPMVLGLMNLATGAVTDVSLGLRAPERHTAERYTVKPLSWSPDGRRLIVRSWATDPKRIPQVGLFVIDRERYVDCDASAGPASMCGLPPDELNLVDGVGHAAAFLSADRVAIAFSPHSAGQSPRRVFAADLPERGALGDRETLFEVEERVQLLSANASGTQLLVGTEGDGLALSRWSAKEGMRAFDPSEFRVNDAAWAPGQQPPPEYFVAVTQGGELQLRRTADGAVVRTLRRDVDLRMGLPRVAASPDGNSVFIDHVPAGECRNNTSRTRHSIYEIPLGATGERRGWVGSSPVISPDGTKIAFLTNADSEGRCGEPPETLVVQRLDPKEPAQKRWTVTSRDWSVETPHWSPDNRMIQFTMIEGPSVTTRLLDTEESSNDLADAEVVADPEFGTRDDYLTSDEIVSLRTPNEGGPYLQSVDVLTGKTVRTLTRVGGERDGYVLDVDPEGGHVLYFTRQAGARSEDAPVELLRYSLGALDPVKITDGIVAAAWVK